MTSFHGIVPPLLTPLLPDGGVDVGSLDRLVDHVLDHGVHGLFVLGSSGQVAYLTDDEREQVIGHVVDRTAGRVPVLVGTPDLTARRVVDQAHRAVAAGADVVVVTAPMYALNDADEIDRHFRMIGDAMTVPVLAYDVPVRVHHKLDTELLLSLGRDGVIAGVKDSSGDDEAFYRLLARNAEAESPLAVFTGHEVVCDAMFRAGAAGAVPGLSNVDPAGYVRMWQAAQQGDWETAGQEQQRITRLFDIVFSARDRSPDTAGISSFKAALVFLGVLESDTMPAPLSELGVDETERVELVLREVGLIS